MKSGLYSLACPLYCGVLVCWNHVVAHGLHGAGGMKVGKFAPSAPFFSLPSALLPARQYRQTREQQGQRQPVSEWPSQQEAVSAPLMGCVPPSSCDYSPSFVQAPVNAETDVSCFPHEADIGSTAQEFKRVSANAVVDCLRLCRADDNCSHFTWNKFSKMCHLKKVPPVFYTYKGDMTGPRSCDTTCFVGCLTYNTEPMKTFDWGDLGNKAPVLCQSACYATDGCLAFVFENGVCKLFGKGFSAYRVVSGGSTIAGPKFLCVHPSDLRLSELLDGHRIGSCLKSDNIGSTTPEIQGTGKVANVAECQKRCQDNKRCNHFTYNTVSHMCFLKEGMPPAYYMKEEDITGDKMCKPA